MSKVLAAVIVLVLHSIFLNPALFASTGDAGAQKIKYEYFIDTDLSAGKFSEAFCNRLSEKHNWEKVSATVGSGDTYTSIFSFKDEKAHSWKCEVQISRLEEFTNRMFVEMTMMEVLES